jgi:hypothetical protein
MPARPSPFSSRQVACHVYLTRYLGNAMNAAQFLNLGVGSVYDVAQTNL